MALNKSRYILLLIILIGSVFTSGTIVFAQEQAMNLEVEVEITIDNEKDSDNGILVINCFGAEPYLYMLYDSPPWDNGKIIAQNENIYDSTINISDLSSGGYYLMVQDADKKIFAKSIRIE